MFCTSKEQQTCDVEKQGCEGCYYNNDENVVNQMKEFVEYIKANEDKVNKSHELLTILEGMLNLYWMEKEKNQKLEKAFQDIIDMISEEIEKSDNHKGDE